ncbi:MAG: NAD-dependent epimerase/dehydratase family protein [Pirellulales bacterium]
MSGRVLVTGGTGFVGRQVLRALHVSGHALRVVIRRGSAARLPVPVADADVIESDDLFAERAPWWEAACTGIDTVVHLAWYAEPGRYLVSPRNLACLAGTLALAEGAIAAGIRRFVGIGTCFEYDLTSGHLSTDTPLAPLTPYAATKAAAFLALAQTLPAAGMSFVWCRLFYLHGEGEDPRRLTAAIRTHLSSGESIDLTSGTQIRDFLDVGEAGARIASMVDSDRCGPVNICSGRGITVRALAESIADEYGRRDLLRFGARPDNLVDPPCVVGLP